MKKMIAKKIPSKIYGSVIEVNTAMRFYWDRDGNFDGVEYAIPKGTSSYQRRLIWDTIGIVQLMMVTFEEMNRYVAERNTPVPDYVKRAFMEDDDLKPA